MLNGTCFKSIIKVHYESDFLLMYYVLKKYSLRLGLSTDLLGEISVQMKMSAASWQNKQTIHGSDKIASQLIIFPKQKLKYLLLTKY